MSAPPSYDIVVPSVARPSLLALLRSLAGQRGLAAERIVVVDDRADADVDGGLDELLADVRGELPCPVEVRASGGRGPAAARNDGWRGSTADWIVFLDDDVEVPEDWARRLATDLAACPARVAGSQGRLRVPLDLPDGVRPTDWQRHVKGLEQAAWATADMAYRRAALMAVGGFDERFPRAYREDADIALRMLDVGMSLRRGMRVVEHPVRTDVDDWVSLRLQAGNADDPLMTALHGRGWRRRAAAPRGRRVQHVATTAALVTAVGATLTQRRAAAAMAASAWLLGTAELAIARIRPGPRDRDEVRRMLLTSLLMPPVATGWWLTGVVRARTLRGAGVRNARTAATATREGSR